MIAISRLPRDVCVVGTTAPVEGGRQLGRGGGAGNFVLSSWLMVPRKSQLCLTLFYRNLTLNAYQNSTSWGAVWLKIYIRVIKAFVKVSKARESISKIKSSKYFDLQLYQTVNNFTGSLHWVISYFCKCDKSAKWMRFPCIQGCLPIWIGPNIFLNFKHVQESLTQCAAILRP